MLQLVWRLLNLMDTPPLVWRLLKWNALPVLAHTGLCWRLLGGLLEALESILGAVGGFGRGKEDPQRLLALFWGPEGQS